MTQGVKTAALTKLDSENNTIKQSKCCTVLKTAENEEEFSNLSVPAHLWWLPLDLRAGFNHLLGYSPAGRTMPTRQVQILSVHILKQQH